ncbi:transglycosylase SLT domain-containing protein [Dechloromonas denitrificans]|uniref:transglycosylase SLT domain-containing protein n=1 Tax=Dechloromonas denitrificans TaxID=281362 RepID=UPI001CFC428A|nr:transglycosylase SLT domain-containing protein [Dechloromonas denitrificans]UCV09330.1 transglycosylase SLT domain-containing protein [Dechloromonas denitrificans]
MSSPSDAETGSPDGALTIHEVRAALQPPTTIDLTAETDNLWDRIRNGFAMTNLNDDLVLRHQHWYQSHPDALRRMVERSRPYLHHIVEELEARGMPTELALLPMVESSFNPMAYSRSHASGLWQFIPATGKRFNLEQNWWQDQRRDIVASTDAALEYLQTIYDMHGDWHLALASYNWGEGAVKRAVDKNNARGLPADYASLTMPNETRNYVPKLQALKNIFGNPVLMVQLGLPEILNRPYFATIDTEKAIDVKTAARLANMPVEDFLALNPSHNRPVIHADSAVVLPADKLAIFRSNLEKNSARLTEWQTYTLKNGEKLDKVAPRFGIALPELLRINGLPVKVRLGAGSTLLVPAGDGAEDLGNLQSVAAPQQIIEPEPVAPTRNSRAATGKTAKAPAKGGGKTAIQASSKGAKPLAKAPAKLPTKPAAKADNGKKAAPTKPAAPSKGGKPGKGRRN